MPQPNQRTASLPSGAVVFLFTDIEGSTALWEEDGARMSQALAAHDVLLRAAVESHGGRVVKMTGDGMHAAFDDVLDALEATLTLQQKLTDPAATGGIALRVRCGLHAGLVERRDSDYFGSPVNRAARIMSAAHGGQALLSEAVAAGLRGMLPPAVSLRDLGKVRLKDLASPEHIYQVVHPLLRGDFPALRSLEATPNNLPQQLTRFIGREQALADLDSLLAKTRFLTLTGSGGCGKTRLSLQVAADALERFSDGAWLVELAPISDPALVPQTVATILGLKEEAGKPISQTLMDHLADKQLLLILDNCEHLLDACAKLVDLLLRHCPQLTILASSREGLGIDGEQAYRVPSLSLPDPKQALTPTTIAPFEAVQLFVDRARLARPDFHVTDQSAAALASICQRLDGIPLAIELSAARIRSLSVDEINRRLDQRFRLLTGGSRTAMPRQQTLRSLIDWSYDLLLEPEKQLLQQLSVFVSGATLDAVEHVCAAGDSGGILDLVNSLCDKSLLLAEPASGQTRYQLLETVRQYARERLLVESADSGAVRGRHLDFFVALAEEAEAELLGADQAMWLERLEVEYDNLRAAIEWALAGPNVQGCLRLCGALQRFWIAHGRLSEGREWCERALQASVASGETPERAKTLSGAGLLAYQQIDYPTAIARLGESLEIRRRLGDRKGVAISLNNLGMVALNQGDLASARALHNESLALARELGNRNGMARSLGNLSMVASEQNDFATARALLEQSLTILRELKDRDGIAISLHLLGDIACKEADVLSARGYFAESLMILRDLGHKVRIVFSLRELAVVTAALGDPLRAARIWSAAERLRDEIGLPAMPDEDPLPDGRLSAARAALKSDPALDADRRAGRALTLERAIDLALGDATAAS